MQNVLLGDGRQAVCVTRSRSPRSAGRPRGTEGPSVRHVLLLSSRGRCEEADKLRATQAELEKQHDEIQSSQSAALKEKQELEQRLRSLQEQLSTQWRHQQEAAQRHSKTEAENRVLRDSLQEALGEHGRLRRDSEKEALSHQEAVKKLEESWRWRLEELRMQMEVQVEHTEAQLALREQELRRKLAEELRLEKEKNEKLKLKHQQETEELQQRLPSLVQAATRDAEERALLLERRLREARDTLAEQEEQEAARRSALQTELQRVRYREQQGALQLDHMRRETWELQEQVRGLLEITQGHGSVCFQATAEFVTLSPRGPVCRNAPGGLSVSPLRLACDAISQLTSSFLLSRFVPPAIQEVTSASGIWRLASVRLRCDSEHRGAPFRASTFSSRYLCSGSSDSDGKRGRGAELDGKTSRGEKSRKLTTEEGNMNVWGLEGVPPPGHGAWVCGCGVKALAAQPGAGALMSLQNALLQETVRRECEEREELTAALTLAREQLLERRSSRTPPTGTGHRRDPRGPQGSPIAATRPPLVLPRLPKASEACNRSFKLVYRNKWRKRRPAAFKPEAQVAAGKRRRGRTRGSGGSGCRQVAPPLPVGKKPPSGRRRARPAAATSSWSG
ncbi:trichohyalin-like [Arapaima gigas]